MKKINSFKIVTVATVLALALPVAASAAGSSEKMVETAKVSQSTLKDAFVPVRTIAEAIGAQVKWEQDAKTITVLHGDTTLVLQIGESTATVNGKTKDIGQKIETKNERAMIPLSFLNEVFATRLGWNEDKIVFEADDYIGRASSFIHDVVHGTFSASDANLSPELQKIFQPQIFQEMWKTYEQTMYGEIGKQISAHVEENTVHINATLLYEAKNMPFEVVIRFNKQGQIDDFFISPFGPSTSTIYQKPNYDHKEKYVEHEVTVGEGPFALPGTLTLPKGEGPFPAVVLVQGSGPHDRDSTMGGMKPFRDIAVGLAEHNIAVLRYEKITKEHHFKSFDPKMTLKRETVDDALKAVALLKNQKAIDPSKIFVAGHSQGGFAVPMMIEADKDKNIAGAILLAGPSQKFDAMLVEQQEVALERMNQLNIPTEAIKQQEQAAAMWKSISEMINDPQYSIDHLPENFPAGYPYWWFEIRDYIPSEAAKEQKTPMLVMQGENDWQVSVKQFEGWKAALKNRQDVEYKLYPKVNHFLTEYDGISIGMEYSEPANVPSQIIDDIAAWIKKVK